jgi:hypothetical protein
MIGSVKVINNTGNSNVLEELFPVPSRSHMQKPFRDGPFAESLALLLIFFDPWPDGRFF